MRVRLPLVSLVLLGVAIPSSALAAPSPKAGFQMPSGLVTCRVIESNAGVSELFCSATYLTKKAYDGVGVVKLPRSARARIVGSGNDILLLIGGYDPNTNQTKRPRTLAYGKTFRSAGYTCASRKSGLTCRRGTHGFFLSKERQRLF